MHELYRHWITMKIDRTTRTNHILYTKHTHIRAPLHNQLITHEYQWYTDQRASECTNEAKKKVQLMQCIIISRTRNVSPARFSCFVCFKYSFHDLISLSFFLSSRYFYFSKSKNPYQFLPNKLMFAKYTNPAFIVLSPPNSTSEITDRIESYIGPDCPTIIHD